MSFSWEQIEFRTDNNIVSETKRAKVIGGWIVKSTDCYLTTLNDLVTDMIFISDPEHKWNIK